MLAKNQKKKKNDHIFVVYVVVVAQLGRSDLHAAVAQSLAVKRPRPRMLRLGYYYQKGRSIDTEEEELASLAMS